MQFLCEYPNTIVVVELPALQEAQAKILLRAPNC